MILMICLRIWCGRKQSLRSQSWHIPRQRPSERSSIPLQNIRRNTRQYAGVMRKKTECHFIDLPSETFLAIPEKVYLPGSEDTEGEEGRISVYHQLDEKSKEDGHETFLGARDGACE